MNRVLLVVLISFNCLTIAQNKQDKGKFVEYERGYYQNYILKGIEDFEIHNQTSEPRVYFTVDKFGLKFPNDTSLYRKCWHSGPVSQGATGTCWCFAGVAMIESEIFRTLGKRMKLSEMYIVYWEYVDRAESFVRTRGETYFAEGSESNAVLRIMKKYGCVPASAYSGMLPGQTVHNHQSLIDEMNECLDKIKETSAWNVESALLKVRAILDNYLGPPPEEFIYENQKFTPLSFLSSEVVVKPDDYFSFMSTMETPYFKKGELVEADNWWHNDDYYNVPLEDFVNIIPIALDSSYTVCMCGDVSEPGYDRYTQTGIIPTFDIPSEFIDENARQMRLENNSTSDDHCMLVVGYCVVNDQKWFVLKDSGAGAYDGKQDGYRFVNEDYIRLKMMNLMLYKYAARHVLDKIIK